MEAPALRVHQNTVDTTKRGGVRCIHPLTAHILSLKQEAFARKEGSMMIRNLHEGWDY